MGTLHVRLDLPVSMSSLRPSNSMICPGNGPKRPPEAPNFVKIGCRRPQTKNRPYLWLHGSKCGSEGTYTTRNPPLFVVFIPQNCLYGRLVGTQGPTVPSTSIPTCMPSLNLTKRRTGASASVRQQPPRQSLSTSMPSSRDGSGPLGHLPRPGVRLGEPPGSAERCKWWVVSSADTRARLAIRWVWVVRRQGDPHPPRPLASLCTVATSVGVPPTKRHRGANGGPIR